MTRMRSAFKHGREAMGDDERRAAVHQAVERLLHQRLALGIERGGRLVEQQHRRILQDGAGDGDALALAAGKRDAALADLGVVALVQPGDEFVGLGGDGRGADLFARGAGAAEGDVVVDRGGEDGDVLRHDGDALAQFVRVVPARIDAIDRRRCPAADRRSAAAARRRCSCRRRTGRRWRRFRPA